jgi:hypothetical protein
VNDPDELRVTANDADVDAARAAILEALQTDASEARVTELLLDWARLVHARDLQFRGPSDDVDPSP